MKRRGTGTWVGVVLVAVVTFFYRYLTLEFTNDHFVHLSRAFQIVEGEVPLRDFFDPGLFLQYYASAAALLWSGHNLLGEGLLTAGFIALGSALTFLAAHLGVAVVLDRRGSGDARHPRDATSLQLPEGRLLRAGDRCRLRATFIAPADRGPPRSRSRPPLAFLFRYDHGVYISVSIAVLLLIRHWPQLPDVGRRW